MTETENDPRNGTETARRASGGAGPERRTTAAAEASDEERDGAGGTSETRAKASEAVQRATAALGDEDR